MFYSWVYTVKAANEAVEGKPAFWARTGLAENSVGEYGNENTEHSIRIFAQTSYR